MAFNKSVLFNTPNDYPNHDLYPIPWIIYQGHSSHINLNLPVLNCSTNLPQLTSSYQAVLSVLFCASVVSTSMHGPRSSWSSWAYIIIYKLYRHVKETKHRQNAEALCCFIHLHFEDFLLNLCENLISFTDETDLHRTQSVLNTDSVCKIECTHKGLLPWI